MASNAFLAPLKGEVRLITAWWVYGLAVNVVGLTLALAVREVTGPESLLPIFVVLPVCIYWTLGVWQCAYNCSSRALGTYIRVCVAASLLGVAYIGIAALTGKWIVAT